jgi:urea transport system substrate-binding protein
MGSVVLIADETVAAPPDVVYGLFGARKGVGWVFAADCDVLAVGSVLTLQLPVGAGQAHGVIVGECFVPLGTKDFEPVIDAISSSGADLILSTLVGADEVAFERQCLAMPACPLQDAVARAGRIDPRANR